MAARSNWALSVREKALQFSIDQIDHIELVVPSRFQAADWYGRVLGLAKVSDYEFWSKDPHGPLMIATPSGDTKIALFRGESKGSKPGTGYHLLAFRANAEKFLLFLNQLNSLKLIDRNGNKVVPESISDHSLAFSIYFCDPWQNEIEITTYDHEAVRASLHSSPSGLSG